MFRVQDEFRRTQLAVVALFCSLGFQYATWASRIPAIKAHLGLSTAEVGLLLMATGVGAAASFPLVAMLMKRLGSRRLSLLSALCLALLLLAMAELPNYPVALVVMCADGVLVGALNVSMNAQGAALEVRFRRNTMARLHATFSGGSLVAALLASGMNLLTSSVLVHFAVAAGLLLLAVGYARPGLLLQVEQFLDADLMVLVIEDDRSARRMVGRVVRLAERQQVELRYAHRGLRVLGCMAVARGLDELQAQRLVHQGQRRGRRRFQIAER